MKKSLFITLDFPPVVGGVARYYQDLVEQFTKEEVLVVAPCARDTKESSHTQVLRKNLLWSHWLWPRWTKSIFTIWRLVRIHNINILWAGQLLPIGTVCVLLKLFSQTPYIVFVHGMDIGILSGRKKYLAKIILKNASFVVANSRHTEKLAQQCGVLSSVIVHPCPTDLTVHTKSNALLPQKLQNKPLILSVGRLVERKGFDRIIALMPQLLEKLPDTHYAVIGDGEELSALQQRVDKLSKKHPLIQERVHFIGKVVDEKLAAYYRAATVFAMPNQNINGDVEGFGLVYLEAALFGKPAIAGNSGGAPEAVIHEKTGLIVKNDTELLHALIKLLTDTSYRERLGSAAKKRARKEFQWDVQAQKLKQALAQLSSN